MIVARNWNTYLNDRFGYTAPGNGIERTGRHYDAATNTYLLYVAHHNTKMVADQYFTEDGYYQTVDVKHFDTFMNNPANYKLEILVGGQIATITETFTEERIYREKNGTVTKRPYTWNETYNTCGIAHLGTYYVNDYTINDNGTVTFEFLKRK